MEKNKNENNQKTLLKLDNNINNKTICSLIISILIIELLVGYYLQSSILNDVDRKYVGKNDLNDLFVHLLKHDQVKNEIKLIIKEFDESVKFEKITRRKRGALAVDDNLVTSGHNKEHHVEFFNPKMRHELENKGAAPGGDPWVWLTSYSRIPVSSTKFFLKSSKQVQKFEIYMMKFNILVVK